MVSTGKSGLEAKVAGTSPNRSLHVPKWLSYGAAAVAALGIGYFALRAAGLPLPPAPSGRDDSPKQEQQYKPNGGDNRLPGIVLPTPAVSQYQRQALEQIAAIGQKEPGLALLLQKTDWFSDGVTPGEANFVAKVRSYIEQGNYSTGAISSNESSLTTVLVMGADKGKREASLAITRQYLPRVSQLLKIEYKKPMLIIDIFQGGGGASYRNVDITNPDDLEHELVHIAYEHSKSESIPLAQIPPWLKEGLPELVRRYLKGGESLLEIGRKNLSADPKSWGIEPLFEMTLKPSTRIGGGSPQAVYEGGFLFLAEYKSLVGDGNFWDALKSIHTWRVDNGQNPPYNTIINDTDLQNPIEETKSTIKQQHEAIRIILKQHVPSEKQREFDQLYWISVYGRQERLTTK